MDKIQITKQVVSFVVGIGTSRIVAGIVQRNTAPERITDQVAITAGTFVLGAMIGDITKKYTDAKIDELVAWWNENVKKKS